MALKFTINPRQTLKIDIGISLKELMDRLVKLQDKLGPPMSADDTAIRDDEVNDTCWINYNALVEIIEELNEGAHIILRPHIQMGLQQMVIEAPKDIYFYRQKPTRTSSGL